MSNRSNTVAVQLLDDLEDTLAHGNVARRVELLLEGDAPLAR